jgi:Cu+-exporting ATPase
VKPGVAGGEQPERDRRDAQLVILRRRLIAAIALSIPVAVLAMASPLQFARWQWLALALATPVVFWSGAASTVPP